MKSMECMQLLLSALVSFAPAEEKQNGRIIISCWLAMIGFGCSSVPPD